MERRYEIRLLELLDECETPATVFTGVMERLRIFAEPFVRELQRQEQREHTHIYLQGLLSDLQRKNTESIAYRYDQDRRALQNFLGSSPWEHDPLLTTLTQQVGETLGEDDAVLVFDPSGFAKKGMASVGVARQWLGRLGKVDNGQVGIYLGYVARQEHALVDVRLYVPEEWARDYDRRQSCGIPRHVRFQTRHELALAMLDERRAALPHRWIAGDDEMGRSSSFRAALRNRHERYLLAVPSNTSIRDLEGEAPVGCGRGAPPKRPFEAVSVWTANRMETAWTWLEVRDAEKGPLRVQVCGTRVEARDEDRCIGPEETLFVMRALESDGSWKYDYYLSNAEQDTPEEEFARVAKAEHRIEECFQRGKSEAGLADYEVRTWRGWYHHQTLSLLASWFLVQETLRGKPLAPAITLPQIRAGLALLLHEACGVFDPDRVARLCTRRLQRTAQARLYHWRSQRRLAPCRIHQRR
jgi:SRSO17 transposase